MNFNLKNLKKIIKYIPFYVIISLFFFSYTFASASTYYVDSSITDTNVSSATPDCTNYNPSTYLCSGGTSSAYKTLADVNAKTYSPGDSILFKKGDTFYGSITVNQSGTSGNPITFSSYGTGNQPVITGFTTISGWTSEGGGIYSKVITAESSPQMVTIDGNQYAMGRWPNTTWRTITGASGNVQISDSGLTGTPNWTGAEVVIRKNRWIIDRDIITSQNTTQLNFSDNGDGYNAKVGWGYFIQNSLSTLDTFGEWYYDTSTNRFYMYFGAVDPVSKIVKVSSIDKLINSNGSKYITINGISLLGSNISAIYRTSGDYTASNFIINNCNISFSGTDGIYFQRSSYVSVIQTTITNTNNNAVFLDGNFGSYNNINNSTITNTGTIPGAGKGGDGNYVAIKSVVANELIEYNTITNSGYIPIYYGGQNTIVRNNFIDNFSYIKDDGGGIYCYGDNATGKQVLNNIVMNGIGAYGTVGTSGTPDTTSSARGIYGDGSSSNIYISNNTLANISASGIHLNGSSNITIENNTIFQSASFFDLVRFNSTIISTISATNNIVVSTINNASQTPYAKSNIWYSVQMYSSDFPYYNNSLAQEVAHLGVIDSNYYSSNTSTLAFTYSSTTVPANNISTYYTIDNWKSILGYDTNSTFSTNITNPSDYLFEYNATTSNRVVTLTDPMIDMKGTKYTGSVTLLPYTSIVLIKDPNPTRTTPTTFYVSNTGSDSNNGTSTSTPWQTIAKVNASTFIPGDQILFKKGDTWTNETIIIPSAGSTGNLIKISSYGSGNKPIIISSLNNPVIKVNSANRGYWDIDGIDLRSSGNVLGGQPISIYFDYWPDSDIGIVPGWIIQNCDFKDQILVSGPNIIIRNNTWNGVGDINARGGAIAVRGVNGANAIIEGNTISNFIDRGIWIYRGANSPVIRNNIVYNITPGADNDGMGINIDGYSIPVYDAQVYGNHVYDCGGVGISNENGYNAEYYNNLIERCGWAGLDIIFYGTNRSNASNINYHNNVIINCNWGFVTWDANTYTLANNVFHNGTGDKIGYYIASDSSYVSGITYVNNIISGVWTHPLSVPDTKNIWVKFDNNIISPNGSEIISRGGVVLTLTQLQALGLMTNGFISNPLFIDSTNGNFHLQSSSPAINAGVNVGLTSDYEGNPIIGLPDIGAYESNYTSDTTKPTVTSFTIPSTSTSLTVSIGTFTATDTVGVTGYKLTETSTAPLAGDSGWTSSAPTTYTFSTEGSKTLYAWAKDESGNVSTSVSKTVTITLPARTTPTTFYISNTGSDSNNGTSTSTPWQTISKVNASTFIPGDQILFKKGDTWNNEMVVIPTSGNANDSITFSTYGSGLNPVIDGNNTKARCISTNSKSYITIDGIDCKNVTEFGIGSSSTPGNNIIVRNLNISAVGIDNNERVGIYNIGGYSTITNNTITNISQNAIQFTGGNNIITHNNISYTNARYTGWGAGIAGDGNNDEIAYNTIINNGGVGADGLTHGIYIGTGSTNANVHNNIITNSSRGSGIKSNGGGNFYNNYVSSSRLSGIEVGFNSTNTAVINIYNNIFSGNREGISESGQGTGSLSLSIYNNTFYYNNSTAADSYYSELSLNDNINTSLIIKNNILFGYGRYTYAFGTLQSHANINNNLVYQASGNLIYYNGSARTWSTWKSYGFDTNGINTNPLLVNPTSDFHLQSTSPAINAGTNVGLTSDYEGNSILGLPDIGAYESNYSSDTTTPTISSFTIPSTSTSLTVSISTFTATDTVGVTGYKLTETSTAPLAGDSGWTSSAPTTYTFSTEGSKTLYAWAKDAAGNVSTSVSKTVTITLPLVTATTFTLSGPTSGNINTASTNFTITPNNTYTGTITITPSGTGATGLSPIVKTFSSSSTAQTFTITPTVAGSITLTPSNNGGLTNPSSLTYTSNAVVPGAPTSVSATAGNASATVSFLAPSSNGGSTITGYTVTSIPSGGTDTNGGTTSLTHTITGLTNGTSYTFTVKATNAIGQSVASTPSSAVTPQATTYTLTINKSGTGTGTTTGANTYTSGTVVTATATPDSGSTFTSWSGDCNTSGVVTMTKDMTCTATFTLIPVSSGGGGGGGSSSSSSSTAIPTTLKEKAKSKDIKQDGSINIFDFNIIMANWNKTYTTSISLSKGDMTGDGAINIFDINQLMIYWGVGY